MGEEANCIAAMEACTKAKENGHAVPAPKPDDAVVVVAAPAPAEADPRLQGISDAIRVVPHFPKQGTSPLHRHLFSLSRARSLASFFSRHPANPMTAC
jgi:hypothetical protein